MYLRLQEVCVLPLWCVVLPVREVVRQHGVDQLAHLLLFSTTEELRVHLEDRQDFIEPYLSRGMTLGSFRDIRTGRSLGQIMSRSSVRMSRVRLRWLILVLMLAGMSDNMVDRAFLQLWR